jgi:hypothetical protein
MMSLFKITFTYNNYDGTFYRYLWLAQFHVQANSNAQITS